jgi:hypothetical protein
VLHTYRQNGRALGQVEPGLRLEWLPEVKEVMHRLLAVAQAACWTPQALAPEHYTLGAAAPHTAAVRTVAGHMWAACWRRMPPAVLPQCRTRLAPPAATVPECSGNKCMHRSHRKKYAMSGNVGVSIEWCCHTLCACVRCASARLGCKTYMSRART